MENTAHFQYEYFSSVLQHKVDWLWYPYIPYGKLTILQGDPGEGKSTFILNIAALLTRGHDMPDGFHIKEPERVIYQTAEDNIADTVKPRLIAAGADCNRIAYIIDEDMPLTLEDDRFEKVLQQTGARLFILDPLQGYLTQDSDLSSAGKMRSQLKKLVDLAAKYRCAIVIVGHMNKQSGEKNIYRGLGSIDITAIARSVLMVARDKENPNIRYMFPIKSSLAPEGQAIAFSFTSKNGITWMGKREQIEKMLQSKIGDDNKRTLALRLLYETLSCGDVLSSAMLQKCNIFGISARTLQTAKKELNIQSYRKEGAWYWHLPEADIVDTGEESNGE